MTHECAYCKKTFYKESTLLVHVCEQKKRRQEQSERGVQLGFHAYLRFYEAAQGSARLKTYEDFCESSYYRAFVKFGRYCVAIRAVNPEKFLEWLLKNNKKIDKWASDQLYTEYLIQYICAEPVNDALARTIEFSIDWAEKNSAEANDCLRYGNSLAICYAITTGRVSPWVLYNCESGQRFLDGLDPTQINMIWPYINTEIWLKRFSDHLADQEYVRDILKKGGW